MRLVEGQFQMIEAVKVGLECGLHPVARITEGFAAEA